MLAQRVRRLHSPAIPHDGDHVAEAEHESHEGELPVVAAHGLHDSETKDGHDQSHPHGSHRGPLVDKLPALVHGLAGERADRLAARLKDPDDAEEDNQDGYPPAARVTGTPCRTSRPISNAPRIRPTTAKAVARRRLGLVFVIITEYLLNRLAEVPSDGQRKGQGRQIPTRLDGIDCLAGYAEIPGQISLAQSPLLAESSDVVLHGCKVSLTWHACQVCFTGAIRGRRPLGDRSGDPGLVADGPIRFGEQSRCQRDDNHQQPVQAIQGRGLERV